MRTLLFAVIALALSGCGVARAIRGGLGFPQPEEQQRYDAHFQQWYNSLNNDQKIRVMELAQQQQAQRSRENSEYWQRQQQADAEWARQNSQRTRDVMQSLGDMPQPAPVFGVSQQQLDAELLEYLRRQNRR